MLNFSFKKYHINTSTTFIRKTSWNKFPRSESYGTFKMQYPPPVCNEAEAGGEWHHDGVAEKHPTVSDIIMSLSDVTGARAHGHPLLRFK